MIFPYQCVLGRVTLNDGSDCEISETSFPPIDANSEELTFSMSTQVINCAMTDLYSQNLTNSLLQYGLAKTPFKFDNRVGLHVELTTVPKLSFTEYEKNNDSAALGLEVDVTISRRQPDGSMMQVISLTAALQVDVNVINSSHSLLSMLK